MKRRKFLCAAAAIALLAALPAPAFAAGIECDSAYCFSPSDFSEDEALAGVCLTGLPDPEAGTLLLGSRVLRPGDILTAEQLACVTFTPMRGEERRETVVTYLPIYRDRVEAAEAMSIAVIGRKDQPPVAEDSAIETYRNLPNEAVLKVKDPEGQALTLTLVRAPRRGEVTLRNDGSFTYVPKKNKVGVDSFTYTAADPSGNVSREATVTVTILKPTDAAQYSDTEGNSCRFAAEWMKNTGIFASESIGGNTCFRPEKGVCRGEFIAMLTRALRIPPEEAMADEFAESPEWLRPYLAAALRSGLTSGLPEGDAEAQLTGAETAVLLQNALDLPVPELSTAAIAADESGMPPEWAAGALAALERGGITLTASQAVTRGEAAELLYTLTLLLPDAPGMNALRTVQQ